MARLKEYNRLLIAIFLMIVLYIAIILYSYNTVKQQEAFYQEQLKEKNNKIGYLNSELIGLNESLKYEQWYSDYIYNTFSSYVENMSDYESDMSKENKQLMDYLNLRSDYKFQVKCQHRTVTFCNNNCDYWIDCSSSSMYPALNCMSKLSLCSVKEDDLELGQIIAFKVTNEYKSTGLDYTIHRLVGIEEIKGKRYYTTRGDYNVVNDSIKIVFDDIIGVVYNIDYSQ